VVNPVPKAVRIGNRLIGPGHPCFLIAEAGVNHNGSLDLALKLVDAAAAAGADAVKFQTFRAEDLVTPDAPKAAYQKAATGESESQFDMLKRLELDERAHEILFERCGRRGILFLSTPFEERSSDFLERLGVPAFKVPSGEVTNLPFLGHLSRKGKPIILSTGMSTLSEVRAAVEAIKAGGTADLALLHCVSAYPADPSDANLRAMATLEDAFGVPVGYSDHTMGIEVALGAAALGACIIEKHFTLDKTMEGPDHRASMEPHELAALVAGVRTVQSALGDGVKRPSLSEEDTARVARKSLVAATDIPEGRILDASMIVSRRPGGGLQPGRTSEILGRRASRYIPAGTLLSMEMVE